MKKILNKFKKLGFVSIIIITLGALGVIFFAYMFYRKPMYLTITVKIGSDNIYWEGGTTRAWIGQLFYEGMKEKDGFGNPTVEVVKIRSYDTADRAKAIYATMKVKVVYYRNSNQYYFKGKPLLIGSTVKLYLDKVLAEGLITYIEGVKDPREKKNLIVESQIVYESAAFPESYGVKPHIADALKEGEEIKDDQGNTLIKILKKRVEDAKKTVVTSDGRLLIQSNPLKKDVYLTLQVQAVKIFNRYYVFDDIPILIGSGIPLNNSIISVWPEVTNITPSN